MAERRISPLKKLDGAVGPVVARCLPAPRRDARPLPLARLLLIRPGGIGDAVHLVPAVQAIRKNFPQAVIDILAERRNAGAFALCPEIRNVYLYDRPRQMLQVLRNRYDVVIDTEQWHRLSAVIARLVKAPFKIGYATNERVRLFTHAIPYSHDDYEVDSFLRLLGPLGVTKFAPSAEAWLQVPEAARQKVTRLLPDGDERPLVVLFPGASIAERRWGAERFREVAAWSLGRTLRVAVVGGEGDREEGERIAADLPVINLAGLTTLAETAAILERAAVVISGDSGILHIAVGLGRPTVSLFGSGIAAKWAPRGPRHVVLNRNLPCSPCTRFGYTPACPHAARCMREIVVDEVTAGIARLLSPSLPQGSV